MTDRNWGRGRVKGKRMRLGVGGGREGALQDITGSRKKSDWPPSNASRGRGRGRKNENAAPKRENIPIVAVRRKQNFTRKNYLLGQTASSK